MVLSAGDKQKVQLEQSSINLVDLNGHDNFSLTGKKVGIFTWEISKRWVDIFVKFFWSTQKPRTAIGKKEINIRLLKANEPPLIAKLLNE